MSFNNLPRYATRAELGRNFGVDPRTLNKHIRPIAVLIAGGKETPLFDANLFVNLSVNAKNHPIESSQVEA
jgi:hypothetical protein